MMAQPNVMSQRCASRVYMALLADKWSLLIINSLGEGPRRNGELVRSVEGIWDCQEFRVWAGIMGKKESHYVPTKRTCDPV